MNNENRMVDTYEIKYAILIGDKEILFGIDDKKTDHPYLVCNCTSDNPLNISQYSNGVGSADYLEMMTEFVSRISEQIKALTAERDNMPFPRTPVTQEHCTPNDYSESIENKVVVIRAGRLRPEYRTADNQIVLATGGFGSYANARGRAVYTVNLYSGKKERWNREDVIGVLKPEYMPDWAKDRLAALQAEKQTPEKFDDKER